MIRHYFALTKPGIIMGNAITAACGFMVASGRDFHLLLFIFSMLGLSLIIASACVFNNILDRIADGKMSRTKHRPIARGLISPSDAGLYASVLGIMGFTLLFLFTNLLTLTVAFIGFLVYVLWYTTWKYKTVHGTLIGSIAGASPITVGYLSVSNQIDLGAVLCFSILVLWQMPHFFAIAMYRLHEYKEAAIPVLPLVRGMEKTKVQMLLYIIGFVVVASLLTFFHITGMVALASILGLGAYWLYFAMKGFKAENNVKWGRKMFVVSLFVITTLCLTVSVDAWMQPV